MRPEDAAVVVASRFGVVVADAVILSDSNNVVVWLRPASLVAKVATGHHRRFDLELAVAQHLAAQHAPVAPPAKEIPQEVHAEGGFEMTFWTYQPHRDEEPNPQALAHALFDLHEAMLGFNRALPSYQDELDAVAKVLGDARQAVALRDRDRALLLSALERFQDALVQRDLPVRALHGSPHDSNTLVTTDGIRFIDFETACVGPLEWDLAHVGDDTVTSYPGSHDPSALTLCRALVSVKTAVWCWRGFDHSDLRWHAQHHLAVVHQLMTER